MPSDGGRPHGFVRSVRKYSPVCGVDGSHLLLCGVQRGVRVRLCTLEGRTLRSVVATGAPLRFEFGPMRGLFLLETSDGFREKIVR